MADSPEAESGRVLDRDYLHARGEAFEHHEHMDPSLELALSTHARHKYMSGEREHLRLLLWLAFMAGSDWERHFTGARYTLDIRQ